MQTLLKTNKAKLLSAMPVVKKYDSRLGALNDWWGKIELIGKINSRNMVSTILDDMGLAKGKFGELQQKLTQNLLLENLQKLVLDNASKAQVAIDLLIRNLFERTADVGFLATDDDIRRFLAVDQPTAEQVRFIENRLQEYVKKYSVYGEIIVLDTQGYVKAHLDKQNSINHSADPLLKETLATDKDYVETFRYSDLQAAHRHALIYSCKITETQQSNAKVLGILCLCFRFDDEMNGIFANLLSQGRLGVLTVQDADGEVIASSDENVVRIQTKLYAKGEVGLMAYQSQDYIVITCQAQGYQGYFGLGWRGQMLIPLVEAFNREETAGSLRADYAGMLEQACAFPKELREIRQAAVDINADLGLLVLNGQIVSARKKAAEFMPVLEAIKQIGSDIAQIFADSVNSLETTVLSSYLDNAGFLAALAVDIMDRNLYERANDCRWWAMTSVFRRNLAHTEISEEDINQISNTLQYINLLYTVYTNIYVYDQHGEVLAVSNADERARIGTTMDETTGAVEVLKNSHSQHYGVSAFIKTDFYQQRYTYLYNAAITDLGNTGKVLGGIGLVFDSEPQFTAMLADVLPRDTVGDIQPGSFALFADRKKTILAAANHPELKAGDTLNLDKRFFELKNGQRVSNVVQYGGINYVLGVAASQGYREYKTCDDYKNDILAFIFIPF